MSTKMSNFISAKMPVFHLSIYEERHQEYVVEFLQEVNTLINDGYYIMAIVTETQCFRNGIECTNFTYEQVVQCINIITNHVFHL